MTQTIHLRYQDALVVAADLIGPECLAEGLDNEYVRGQCELLGDLYGRPGVELADRKEEVLEDLRNVGSR